MLSEPNDRDDGRAFADGDLLRGMTVEDDRAAVELQAAGATHRITLRAERAASRLISCRADEPAEPVHWRVETLATPGIATSGS